MFPRDNLITGILNRESIIDVRLYKGARNINNKSISKEFGVSFEHPMSSLVCKRVMYDSMILTDMIFN